jgi:hypothetical protein
MRELVVRRGRVVRALTFLVCPFATMLVGGCAGADAPRPVSGTVKFSDGTVPQGEIAMIRFDPVSEPKAGRQQQPASAPIQPDGSFALTTTQQGDGAVPGQYKVVLAVFKKHESPESPVPKKYHRPDTTPLEATVEAGGDNTFDFVVERK